ncbi:MAG: PAS domain S-box protein [Pseudomonadota bacterium]
MLQQSGTQSSESFGTPGDQFGALIERHKTALVGLAAVGVLVVMSQLVFVERTVLLYVQLAIAILLWCALVFHQRLPTWLFAAAVYLVITAFVITGAANIGLAEPSIFALLALVVTSTVIWGLRAGLVTLALVVIALVGLAVKFTVIAPVPFELGYFLGSPIRWAIFLVAVVVSTLWCILVVNLQRTYWLSALTDLGTEVEQRRETERMLRLNEERLRIVTESAPEAITMLDAETGEYLDANPAAEQLHGFSREELVAGMGPWDVSPEYQANGRTSADAAMEYLARANAGEFPKFDWIHVARDGQEKVCEVQLARLPDPHLRLVRASVFDISDRVEAEQRLRQSEQDLRQLVEGSIQGILVINPDRKPIFVNDELVRMFGYDSRDEMLALKSTTELMAPDEVGRLNEIRDAFLAGPRDPLRYVFDARKKDGTRFTIETVAGDIVWRGADAIQATFFDISDRVRYEELIRHTQRMDAIGRLTGGIAHDFNNLLAVIQGNAELLKLSQQGNENIDEIMSAAARGADLTQRLLTYASQREINARPVDLGDAIGEILGMLRRTLGANIVIEEIVAPDLGQVVIDVNQFKDALLNLAINARDAMPDGGKLDIECANARIDNAHSSHHPEAEVGDYVSVTVADTGEGISEEALDKVFEPFFTTKQVGKGTGLGLSMVYGFVKQSGGHVSVSSEAGVGTTVTMLFPTETNASTDAALPSAVSLPLGNGEVVLVVEDDPTVQKMAVEMVGELGYQTLKASTIEEARATLAARESVDLVLSDVVLPGDTTGLAFAADVRAHHPGTGIVVMSGYPAGSSEQGRLDVSDFEYLQKPFRQAELARALNNSLRDRE